jgi:hypothetical protein
VWGLGHFGLWGWKFDGEAEDLNGAKTQLLMHTNTNYLLDLCILLRLFDKEYQLIG